MSDTRTRGYAVIVAAASAVAGLGPARAQENGKVMIDVADCIKLAAPEARLACYESRVAAVFGERAAQAAAARPAATPAPAAPTPALAAPTETAETAPAPAASPVAPASPATPPAAPRTVAVTPAAEPVAPAPAPSRSDRQSRRQESDRAQADAATNDIVSRVKDLREVFPNAWQITLENGQVWRQTVSKHYELRPGAQVKIYTSHWGSAMRLSTEDLNGYIQVEQLH